jgi:ribosomal protein L22
VSTTRFIAGIVAKFEKLLDVRVPGLQIHTAGAFALTLVLSAVTNWENKTQGAQDVDEHDLFIKTLRVDEAGHLKRIRPAPQGRAHRIRKRSNHVTVVIENRIPFDGEFSDEEE